jgi:hypothetical protein
LVEVKIFLRGLEREVYWRGYGRHIFEREDAKPGLEGEGREAVSFKDTLRWAIAG